MDVQCQLNGESITYDLTRPQRYGCGATIELSQLEALL